MDCSQKATSIPLYLKSKVQNQGEEEGGYEHYLVFLEKKEESRSFNVFLYFLGKKYCEKTEKKMPKQLPKRLPFNLSCQEPFIGPGTLFGAPRCVNEPFWCIGSGPVGVSNFVLMHFSSFAFERSFGGLRRLRLR